MAGGVIRGTRVEAQVGAHAIRQPGNPSADASAPDSTVLIFKNLGPSTARYISVGPVVTGKDAALEPELWEAIPFTPRTDVHAHGPGRRDWPRLGHQIGKLGRL